MNLFKEFNIQTFKNKKPPADNSMTTFKEINEINKLPANEKFVKYNDDQEKVFSDIYPKYKRDFMQAADNISKSRLIGKVHYPSDSQNGVELGDALYQHYKNQNNESI